MSGNKTNGINLRKQAINKDTVIAHIRILSGNQTNGINLRKQAINKDTVIAHM